MQNGHDRAWMSDISPAGTRSRRYHALDHPRSRRTGRSIGRSLARLADGLMIVHVDARGRCQRWWQAPGSQTQVFNETCPQYLFLDRADLDRPWRGEVHVLATVARCDADLIWRHVQADVLGLSSDHWLPTRRAS
jgi:dihydropyrimidinase